METMRFLDKNNLSLQEDWYSNNAAVCCFSCGKVFLVSQILHRKGRSCPKCGLTHATVTRTEVVIDEQPSPETLTCND
jgi:uncharacterized paraquat-inducible protein A